MTPILSLNGVRQVYWSRKPSGWGWNSTNAVDDVDIDVREGETLAIVGESGSGKSTLAKLLLMLNTPTSGSVNYRGQPLRSLPSATKSQYRRDVQAVFQDPSSSLNPRMTVAQAFGYLVKRHALCGFDETRAFIGAQLEAVGMTPADQYLERYPHQLSGGQQQRIAIARAMMLRPKIIVADEPLSSLDISIQAQVLELMRDLRHRTNVGFVIISHDLGAMQSVADRTAVMYRGQIVELGPDIFGEPAHPYTRLLLDARLLPDPRAARIRTMAPSPAKSGPVDGGERGCRFRHRCPFAASVCSAHDPVLRPFGSAGTQVACHRAEEISISPPAPPEEATLHARHP